MQISSFPSISSTEFEEACYQLENKFANKKHLQNDWLSVNVVQNHDTKYLRITRVLANKKSQKSDPWEKCESESLEEEEEEEPDPEEFEEDDAEALRHRPSDTDEAVLEYDIILSPSYQVPVLYFSIKDPLFRYPLTTETLYEYIIPEHFRRQISDVGVIGGITLTDHPVTNVPLWFVHPCNTASALERCSEGGDSALEGYFWLWMGVIGGAVGLGVPGGLV